MKLRILHVIMAATTLFALSSTPVFAQDLIANGDFQQTTDFDYGNISDYTRIFGGAVNPGYFIHEVNSTGHGTEFMPNVGGWPDNLYGYGGQGDYYLLFNGFGNATNPTKAAWKQSVTVASQTSYTFSCQVRNLSKYFSFMGYSTNPAIIRIKINGNQVGDDFSLSTDNHDWQEVTRTWNSGSFSGDVLIEIYDVYTGDPGLGDDFGLDHISFVAMDDNYTVNTNDDHYRYACLNTPVDIDVLRNDAITPNAYGAMVEVVAPPLYGVYEVLTDNQIRYEYTAGNAESDRLKYRVSTHGKSGEAWVNIDLSAPTLPVDTAVCAPFTWRGNYIETDGQWSDSISECEIHVLNVTFIQIDTIPNDITHCEPIEFHGITYGPGTYHIFHDTVYNANGCMEAVHLLNLTINDVGLLGTVTGMQNVYVATNVFSGIYQYELNAPEILGDVVWSLSNPRWQIISNDNTHCSIYVNEPGTATLEAQYLTSTCGLVTRSITINGGFYDVDELSEEAKVYPNPTQGSVTIEADGIERVRVINMLGQCMCLQEFVGEDSVVVSLNGYAPSVYLLEIKTKHGMLKKSVVVCK